MDQTIRFEDHMVLDLEHTFIAEVDRSFCFVDAMSSISLLEIDKGSGVGSLIINATSDYNLVSLVNEIAEGVRTSSDKAWDDGHSVGLEEGKGEVQHQLRAILGLSDCVSLPDRVRRLERETWPVT